MDNLPELRDIHLPGEGISIFPPAPGWWLILLLIIVLPLLCWLIVWLRRASARVYARNLLKNMQKTADLASVIKISEILRRICVRKYPEAVALSGDKWINFLNQKSQRPLNEKTAELLKDAPFVKADSVLPDKACYDELWHFCYNWIGDNL